MTRSASFVRVLGCAVALSCLLLVSAFSQFKPAQPTTLNASRLFTTADAERIMGYRLHMIQCTAPISSGSSAKQVWSTFALPSEPAFSPISNPMNPRSYGAIVIASFRFVDPSAYSTQRMTYLSMQGIRDLPNVGDEGWASLDDTPGMIASALVGNVAVEINLFFEYGPKVNRSAVASRLIEVTREVATRIR